MQQICTFLFAYAKSRLSHDRKNQTNIDLLISQSRSAHQSVTLAMIGLWTMLLSLISVENVSLGFFDQVRNKLAFSAAQTS